MNLSATYASACGTEDRRVVFIPFQFSSRSRRQRGIGGNLAVACSALGWRQDGARAGGRRLHFTKRQFSRLTAGLRLKVREGHSDESNALRRREHGTDQFEGDFMQPVPCLDRRFHRPATSGQLKVGPFDLHRDGPTARICLLAPGPDIVSHRDHAGLDLNGIYQVLRESRLRPRRLSFAVGLDRPVVLTSRDVVVPTP
jgi:hypothetical protein